MLELNKACFRLYLYRELTAWCVWVAMAQAREKLVHVLQLNLCFCLPMWSTLSDLSDKQYVLT